MQPTIEEVVNPLDTNLSRLARLSVRAGVNVQPDQELIVSADLSQAEFVREITREAYEAGAKRVQVFYTDEVAELIRYSQASDAALGYAPKWIFDAMAEAFRGGAAYLQVLSPNPSLLEEVGLEKLGPATKAQAAASHELLSLVASGASNWSIVPTVSKAWARQVFPDLEPALATEKLWDLIYQCSYATKSDPVKAWQDHCESLESRRDDLTALGLTKLHFKGPGTDLEVGLAEGHEWKAGRITTKNGALCSPNIPTEEVFTMPHRERTEGTVKGTKPLVVRGKIIDGIEVEFKAGKIVKVSAKQGEEILTRLLNLDEGMQRLGEVALVPQDSSVAKTGQLFYSALFDENAACHIAFGQALSDNLPGSDNMTPEELTAKGMNVGATHIDWMIGGPETEVVGTCRDGSTKCLMKHGTWAF